MDEEYDIASQRAEISRKEQAARAQTEKTSGGRNDFHDDMKIQIHTLETADIVGCTLNSSGCPEMIKVIYAHFAATQYLC